MFSSLMNRFHWFNTESVDKTISPKEQYQCLSQWAAKARSVNPRAFDEWILWLRSDTEWESSHLDSNTSTLREVLSRFLEQNNVLIHYLKELEPFGVVNTVVFRAIERFNRELQGETHPEHLQQVVKQVFANFSLLGQEKTRLQFAGNATGPSGTNSIDFYGYFNALKDADAEVQWALFMPNKVQRQLQGFSLQQFEYKIMPAMRFLGRNLSALQNEDDIREVFTTLDSLQGCISEFPYDILFMHHQGLGVDVGPWQGLWGRFMKPSTLVPEGFQHIDFEPEHNGKAGMPYLSHYAYATFTGDIKAMHQREGFDSDAMYDVTRNMMLGQNVLIPYPDKYWTAEVFLHGYTKPSTAYLFSADLTTGLR